MKRRRKVRKYEGTKLDFRLDWPLKLKYIMITVPSTTGVVDFCLWHNKWQIGWHSFYGVRHGHLRRWEKNRNRSDQCLQWLNNSPCTICSLIASSDNAFLLLTIEFIFEDMENILLDRIRTTLIEGNSIGLQVNMKFTIRLDANASREQIGMPLQDSCKFCLLYISEVGLSLNHLLFGDLEIFAWSTRIRLTWALVLWKIEVSFLWASFAEQKGTSMVSQHIMEWAKSKVIPIFFRHARPRMRLQIVE